MRLWRGLYGVEFEGALYHLTGRGNARQRIFADEADCAKFVQLIVESLDRYDVAPHGYVLMGNHYHLIAEIHRPNLGRWMNWLATAYAVYFNRRHRRVAHLFQGRYKSIVVEAEGYLLSLSRYLHLNPGTADKLTPDPQPATPVFELTQLARAERKIRDPACEMVHHALRARLPDCQRLPARSRWFGGHPPGDTRAPGAR
jgi:REP element-mobilizing transposase RayT